MIFPFGPRAAFCKVFIKLFGRVVAITVQLANDCGRPGLVKPFEFLCARSSHGQVTVPFETRRWTRSSAHVVSQGGAIF